MKTFIDIKKREEENVVVFEFNGELDETNTDETFSSIYEELGDLKEKKVIFNLKELKYLNSKSIGYIADIYSNIEENEGEMYISNCTDGVKDVLELVGITTIIPTLDTEIEALNALKG